MNDYKFVCYLYTIFDERVTLINRYINEIFIEENLKDQFMHMIRTDNKKPMLITKLENSKEITITLDDLKEEGKFRHIKAGYKKKGLFGGRKTRKEGGNKRNKTLKKMK